MGQSSSSGAPPSPAGLAEKPRFQITFTPRAQAAILGHPAPVAPPSQQEQEYQQNLNIAYTQGYLLAQEQLQHEYEKKTADLIEQHRKQTAELEKQAQQAQSREKSREADDQKRVEDILSSLERAQSSKTLSSGKFASSCSAERSAVVKCYNDYRDQPLQCGTFVQAFTACAKDSKKAAFLQVGDASAAKGKAAAPTQKAKS